MSIRFLKPLSVFFATLSLVPTVAALPIPISSPTAIALIVYLSVVPVSFILLCIVKYCYVKNRKADAASGHALSSGFSPQLPFLIGLLGSPDWEIKAKESEHNPAEDTNSQFSFLSLRYRPSPLLAGRHNKFSVFRMLGRAARSPGLRFPPVAHSLSPPDQSFFYALDTPASSTQSSLGNLLLDSALVRLVSGNGQHKSVEGSPGYTSKSPTNIPTPARNSMTSPSSFNRTSPEIKSPPKVKRYTLLRRAPIPPFLPIQTPPDSPILIEPRESSPSGNFTFHFHTPEISTAYRRISHPYAQLQAGSSVSATSGFPRSPSQDFHSCDEQSPGHPSPASPSTSPIHRFLVKVTSNPKSLSPSLVVNVGGGSPFFAPTSGNQDLITQRRASTSYTEDSLDSQSPTLFGSANVVTGVKLVPFSASARASVVSESPSYASEYADQGALSPALPRELEEYYDYVQPETLPPVPAKADSPVRRDGHGQASGSSDTISYGGSEGSGSGLGRKSSFYVPAGLFPIPEEDTQTEFSGSRSRSDPSLSVGESVRVSAASSLPCISSSSRGELVVSLSSASESSVVVNHSTPGTSGTRRPATGPHSITGNVAQTALRGIGISGTSPPNVGTFRRVGARESYPGSGDLNDGAEMSGACMNDFYEELEEWGCEWIRQDEIRQSGPSTGGTEVGTAL